MEKKIFKVFKFLCKFYINFSTVFVENFFAECPPSRTEILATPLLWLVPMNISCLGLLTPGLLGNQVCITLKISQKLLEQSQKIQQNIGICFCHYRLWCVVLFWLSIRMRVRYFIWQITLWNFQNYTCNCIHVFKFCFNLCSNKNILHPVILFQLVFK